MLSQSSPWEEIFILHAKENQFSKANSGLPNDRVPCLYSFQKYHLINIKEKL